MDIKPVHEDILLALYRGEVDTVDDLPYIGFQALLRAQLVTEVAPPFGSGSHKFDRTPMLTPAGLDKCRELFGAIANEPKTAAATRLNADD